MKRSDGGLLVMLAFATSTLLTGGCNPNKASGPAPGETGPQPVVSTPIAPIPPNGAAIVVTPEELTRDYITDNEAAKKRYEEKLVETEGIVKNTGNRDGGDFGHAIVSFDGFQTPGKLPGFILCSFAAKFGEQADQLTKGQKVKVRGKCIGQVPGVWLTNCEILESGPNPAVTIKLTDLAADYAKDVKEADVKYKGKQLILEAVLADVIAREIGFATGKAYLLEPPDAAKPGDQVVKVKATHHPEWDKDFSKLQKGQKIKVKGQCSGMFDASEPGVTWIEHCVLVK